jgi:hypothetical protein
MAQLTERSVVTSARSALPLDRLDVGQHQQVPGADIQSFC